MRLRQLEYFLSVAKARSLTLAAAELGVAQPTLTKSIRALEDELGVKLFRRQPRGVDLTSYGESLLRHAQTLNVQLRDAINELRSLKDGMSGSVTIGAGPAWLRRHLPLAVARMVKRNPAIRVRVDGGFDDVLLRALRRGEVDLVVAEIPSPENARDLKVIPLTSDRLASRLPRGPPAHSHEARHHAAPARLSVVDAAALDAHDAPPAGAVHRGRSAAAGDHGGDGIDGVPDPDGAQLGYHHADRRQYARHARSKDLRLLTVAGLTSRREAGVVLRKDGFLSPAAEAIVDELKHICALEPTN